MLRVPVLSPSGNLLMPTKASRARRWLKEGKARVIYNDLGIFQIQLISCPKTQNTQAIAVGIDPGKLYAGIGVQSAKFTLWLAHLHLPFKTVKDRMEQRAMMRRGRRGRRINRSIAFSKRAHRQKRFDNRRQWKLPPSIRANRELELRIVDELSLIYPITTIAYEIVKARGGKGFSPVMVGQKWQLKNLAAYAKVKEVEGWQTANIRQQLGLCKQKHSKGDAIPATHAVDGVALACSTFIQYGMINRQTMGWSEKVQITPATFTIIRRPPVSRRQLHLMVPAKGGTRRKYGGTVTRHEFRKGDYVQATQGNKVYFGWVSGDTEKQVSVSDASWKRLGQFTAKKVQLVQRSTGLIVLPTRKMSSLMASNHQV
ncbi:RRXRR domain-containing protein [Calothrix sp. FACHB-1219]|uniref:RRXRR domain-containing protein n=1 Tax=unclassified Calothrix TaxID=2619626 RepID=UPI0016838878|nr:MULTISPECIES: RRXRR domain-containing protein [unclassified Calothrix]MBD2204009.1 RRXRR domain-containing protein [Calothrix sp. FACHB-168]MBD2218206.1 RRXRR domain-containing protein [Calothrix sp. FACHB-1219]